MYPNHEVTMKAVTPGWQTASSFVQIASMMLQVKKGNQQIRNTPEMENGISYLSEASATRAVNNQDDQPNTMASVFVALRSFFAELFSRFFLLALFALYIVKRDPVAAFFVSFLQPDEADKTLGVRPS